MLNVRAGLVSARLAIVAGLALSASTIAVAAGGTESRTGIFVEASQATGLDFVHFNGMTGEFYIAEMMGSGVALLDYDNDGDLDVYLVQGSRLEGPETGSSNALAQLGDLELPSDRLYRNDLAITADGTANLRFVDVTETLGVLATGYGMGVATGDYDNDGWVDLYLSNLGSNQLLRNRGDGTFEDTTISAGVDDSRWSVPTAFLDYDGDGWLDLYVGNYVDFKVSVHRPCPSPTGRPEYCGPLAYVPDADRLFRNRGDGTFEDVTATAGLAGVSGGALGVVTADFNGDGRLDLYVGNDQVPNHLWMNQGDGTFRDDALLAGCAVSWEGKPEASMGVHAADFDGDGDEDLILTHLTGETNTLYLNDGHGTFRDHTLASGLGPSSWDFTSFGTAWLDYDNDGWLDLLTVNGAVKVIEAQAAKGDPYPLHQTNQLFQNLGGRSFREVTAEAGEVFLASEVSRGAAYGDLDNDGDPDVVVSNNSGPARLLLNGVGQEAPWLGVQVQGRHLGTFISGARLRLDRADGSRLWSRTRTEGSYGSANDPRVLFGLGQSTSQSKDKSTSSGDLLVEWPEGGRVRWIGLQTGSYYSTHGL